jgi:cell division protein FtsQ
VSIKRLWPESLGLNITEYTVIARWNENELLSQTGGVFQPIDLTNLKSLPRLFGPEDSESRVMEQYHAFNQILFSSDLKLTSLKLTARGSWDLMVNDSIKIKVGRSELVERLQRFKDFYERQKMADELVDVDLRYGNGIAIKRLEKNLTELATR